MEICRNPLITEDFNYVPDVEKSSVSEYLMLINIFPQEKHVDMCGNVDNHFFELILEVISLIIFEKSGDSSIYDSILRTEESTVE